MFYYDGEHLTFVEKKFMLVLIMMSCYNTKRI